MSNCQPGGWIPWQGSKKDVYFGDGGYRALMEDGWTICCNGFGIISVVDSGQEEEDKTQAILEKLRELEAVVDAYMKKNGIKEKYREGLLESVLLWNGYLNEDMPWEYETSEVERTFCACLEAENPSLYN